MRTYSTRQAAQMLGIHLATLQRYIAKRLVPVPALREIGGAKFRFWTERDIEKVRKLLPKVRNGRRKRAEEAKSKA